MGIGGGCRETGRSGGRENCGHYLMYERRIKVAGKEKFLEIQNMVVPYNTWYNTQFKTGIWHSERWHFDLVLKSIDCSCRGLGFSFQYQ